MAQFALSVNDDKKSDVNRKESVDSVPESPIPDIPPRANTVSVSRSSFTLCWSLLLPRASLQGVLVNILMLCVSEISVTAGLSRFSKKVA